MLFILCAFLKLAMNWPEVSNVDNAMYLGPYFPCLENIEIAVACDDKRSSGQKVHDEILSIVVIRQNKNFMRYDLKNASKQYEYFICYLLPYS